jgi:hypothetical protein
LVIHLAGFGKPKISPPGSEKARAADEILVE